jgi:hypothetical protein
MHPQITSTGRGLAGRRGKVAAAGVVVTLLGLGTAACGGGSSNGAGASTSPSATATASSPRGVPTGIASTIQNASASDRSAFSSCMRKNGLPDFPTSLTLTALHAAGITIRSSSFMTAARTCWPNLTR